MEENMKERIVSLSREICCCVGNSECEDIKEMFTAVELAVTLIFIKLSEEEDLEQNIEILTDNLKKRIQLHKKRNKDGKVQTEKE